MRQSVSVIVALVFALGGCSFVADVPLVGVPANAPARSETPGSFLPVHDIPPPRQEEVLSTSDQKRIYDELHTAREKGKATAASDAAAIAAAEAPAKQPAKKKKAEK